MVELISYILFFIGVVLIIYGVSKMVGAAIERPREDWICTVTWVQGTPSEGMWWWKLHLIHDGVPGVIVSGHAFTKLGVYWKVWRACRKFGLSFRPNVRGEIPA